MSSHLNNSSGQIFFLMHWIDGERQEGSEESADVAVLTSSDSSTEQLEVWWILSRLLLGRGMLVFKCS